MLRLRLCAVAACCVLALTACEDPSTVGIELVDEQGDPIVRVLPASTFEAEPRADVTGQSARVLAGSVDDPLLGAIRATGYLDFLSTFDTTSTATITGASLTLAANYVYGDTLAPLTLRLFDLVEDWDADGVPGDTTLPLGDLVTTLEIQPTDTLVTVPLPDAWVAANAPTLRSGSFESLFHGFAIEGEGGNAILGFNAVAATVGLEVRTSADTLLYRSSRNLTKIERLSEPTLPPDLVLLQDGAGPFVRFDFDLEADDFRETPLNGVIIRLFADTTTVLAAPEGFVRPLRESVELFYVTPEGDAFSLGPQTLTDEGHLRYSGFALRELLQRTFFGEELVSHFELRLSTLDNTLDALLLYTPDAGPQAPEAILTLSPFSN